MAEEYVKNVIDAIQAHFARGMERAKMQNEYENQQQRHQEAEDRLAAENKRIDQEHDNQQAHLKLAQSAAYVQNLANKAHLAKMYEDQVPIPNATSNMAYDDPEHENVSIPAGDEPGAQPISFQARSPSKVLADLSAHYAATEGVKAKYLEQVNAAKAEDAFTKQQALIDSKETTAKAERDRREAHDNSQFALLNRKLDLQEAAQNGFSPEDLQFGLKQGINGDISDVQGKQRYGKSYNALVKAMNATGSNFYTTKQQELGGKMAGGISLLPDMQRINDLLKEGIATHPENLIEAMRLGAQVKEKLISTLGILGQGSRLAESRVKAVVDAYGAALVVGGVKSNTQAMKSYRDLLTDVAKENLHGLGAHQINSWLGERGLLDSKSAVQDKTRIKARDPQGVLHDAPAGSKLPAGWTEEKD